MPLRPIAEDPLRNFKFLVDITTGPFISLGFQRVSGLKETTQVVTYREGTDAATSRNLVGQTEYDPVMCERGITNNSGIIAWRRLITDVVNKGRDISAEGRATNQNDPVLRTVNIVLSDYHGRYSWQWSLKNAWPTSLEIGEFSGDGNDVVVETMELVHEGMEVTAP